MYPKHTAVRCMFMFKFYARLNLGTLCAIVRSLFVSSSIQLIANEIVLIFALHDKIVPKEEKNEEKLPFHMCTPI